MTRDPALQTYFAEAASWDADRARLARRSMRAAWWVAGAGWCCALAASVAVMALSPLKRVEPFVIRVNERSGAVDVVPVYAGKAEFSESVARYFLTHYVTVCERFNFATAESDYEECGAFHTAKRNQAWYAAWSRSNPDSPLNIYKDGTQVRAEVVSISFFTRANGVSDLAQVRFARSRRAAEGAGEAVTHWIATVQYAFGEAPSDTRVRRWNPLGFKVIDYRVEPEAVLPDAPSVTPDPLTPTNTPEVALTTTAATDLADPAIGITP